MRWDGQAIGKGDSLFRCIHYPHAFIGKERLFHPGLALNLGYQKNNNTVEASVVWQRFAPYEHLLHEYGCRKSLNRRSTVGGASPNDLYCGSYETRVAAILDGLRQSNITDIVSVGAVHVIERDGDLEHANLEFTLAPSFRHLSGAQLKLQLELLKTTIAVCLWEYSTRGPLRHVCSIDRQASNHPNEKLIDAPRGEYADTRSNFGRLKDILVCAVWGFCYRTSLKWKTVFGLFL